MRATAVAACAGKEGEGGGASAVSGARPLLFFAALKLKAAAVDKQAL